MPTYSDDQFLRLPNPNYNESDFDDTRRSQSVDEAQGIGGVWSPLKSNGQWKLREFAFDRGKWPNTSSAEEWVRTNRTAFKAFGPSPRRIECLEVGFSNRSTGSAPTEAELEQIRGYMLEDIPAEQLYVRTMRLTNDEWGKHHLKLARGFQRNVIGTIPGKSLLLGHPEVKHLAAEPIGRFFDGWVDRDASTGTEWGYAKFYLVKTDQNEHARAQIDGGVWQYASIGMEIDQVQCSICGQDYMGASCRHIQGNAYPRAQVKDVGLGAQEVAGEPGQVYCGVIYRGQGQAIEGSIVFLPELNGTEIVAEAQFRQDLMNGDFGAAKAYLLTQPGDIDGADQEGEGQPGDVEPKEQPLEAEQEAEDMSDDMKTLEAERDTLAAKLDKAQAALEALQAEHTEATEAVAKAAPALASEATFRASAVAELTRLAGLTKREADLATYQSIAGDDLAQMPADKVLALCEAWGKQFAEEHPTSGRQSTPSDGAEDKTDAVEVRHLSFI